MSKWLLIAEKPNQAKAWAAALGVDWRGGSGNTCGSYKGQDFVITHAVGHLFEQPDPEAMVPEAKRSRYKTWSLSTLPWDETDFRWKLKRRSGVADACKAIQAAAKGCDTAAFAGDTDPSGEGDTISAEVVVQLRLPCKKAVRLSFADETVPELQRAFENPTPIPDIDTWPPVMKARFRQKWDYLSMQWTRAATLASGQRKVLRNGRLKSAIVFLVGRQLDAYNSYVKKPYFQNRFVDENEVVYTDPEQPQCEKREDVTGDFHDSDVVCDSKQMKHTAPPKLIDLSMVAGRLASKGISSNEVQQKWQAGYEAGFLSYPRSEDQYITIEQFNEMLPLVDDIAHVVGVDPRILTHRQPRKTHIKTGMAHGANRPGKKVPQSLDALDAQFGYGAGMIYELAARSFLAMFAEDYEYEQQKGHVEDYPTFVATVNVAKVAGWKAVFSEDNGDDDGNFGLGTRAKPFIYEGKNKRPQQPTVKWLMAKLKSLNIGTASTRTSTVADVTNQNSKYPLLKDMRGKLTFAECGEMSYLMLPGTYIADLDMTKRVQEQMADVAKGGDADAYLAEIAGMIEHDIEVMKRNGEAMRKRLGVTVAASSYDYIEFADASGVQRRYRSGFCGHTFTDAENAALQRGEMIEFDDAVSKAGNKFHAKGSLGEDPKYGYGFRLDTSDNKGASDGYVSGTFTGRGKRKGTEVRFKRVFSGHKFTDEEVEKLLAGKEISFDALSKAGNPYKAKGKLAEQSYNGRKFFGFKPSFK